MQLLVVLQFLAALAVVAAMPDDDAMPDLSGLPAELQEFIRQDRERWRSTPLPAAAAATTQTTAATLPDLSDLPPEIQESIRRRRYTTTATAITTQQPSTEAPNQPWLPPEIRKDIPRRSRMPERATETAPQPSNGDADLVGLPPELREHILRQRNNGDYRPTSPALQAQSSSTTGSVATSSAPDLSGLPQEIQDAIRNSHNTNVERGKPQQQSQSTRRQSVADVQPEPDLSGLPLEIREAIRQSQMTTTEQPLPQWLIELNRRTTRTTPRPVAHEPRLRASRLPIRCSGRVELRRQPKCSSGRSKWTFNAKTGRCQWFAHFGCQLHSGNVFNSRRDCQTACVRGVENACSVAQCVPISSLHRAECFLANDTICINQILGQFAHVESPSIRLLLAQSDIEMSCQAPVARCRNTGANFRMRTLEIPPVFEAPKVPAFCRLRPDRGFCPPGSTGRLSRVYFYSLRRNECKFMVHFGCGGNRNRFSSQAQCHNTCAI